MIDCAMGGHIAEEMVMGDKNITSGCGSDLKNATELAIKAVWSFGMFGNEGGTFLSTDIEETGSEYNEAVDLKVK